MITPWRKRSGLSKTIWVIAGLFLLLMVSFATYLKGPLVGLQTAAILVGYPLGLVAIVLAITFFVVGVHELGHVAAGKLAGLSFYIMRIGPFTWKKRARGIQFSLERSGQLSGGYAAMGPTDHHNLLVRHRWFVLGGPLASLALLAIVFVLLPWQDAIGSRGKGESLVEMSARLSVLIFFYLAIVYAAMSIIPFRYRGFYNDAAQLLLPLFDKQQAEYRVLAWKWSAEFSSGKKCADWDKEALLELKNRALSPFEKASYAHCLGNSLLYSGQVEAGLSEIEEAYAYLAKPTKLLVEYETAIALDTSFARAYFAKNLESAKAAYELAESMSPKVEYGHHRAMAAICLLESNSDGVEFHIQKAAAWLTENSEKDKPMIQAAYEEMESIGKMARTMESTQLQ